MALRTGFCRFQLVPTSLSPQSPLWLLSLGGQCHRKGCRGTAHQQTFLASRNLKMCRNVDFVDRFDHNSKVQVRGWGGGGTTTERDIKASEQYSAQNHTYEQKFNSSYHPIKCKRCHSDSSPKNIKVFTTAGQTNRDHDCSMWVKNHIQNNKQLQHKQQWQQKMPPANTTSTMQGTTTSKPNLFVCKCLQLRLFYKQTIFLVYFEGWLSASSIALLMPTKILGSGSQPFEIYNE